jgi:hypothetical protein
MTISDNCCNSIEILLSNFMIATISSLTKSVLDVANEK